MNYYERHLGDYARDTGHLSMLEHGAYTLLLDRYYASEQGIPADQAHRITRARTREEKAATDAVLSEFFTLSGGVWRQSRADDVITDYREGDGDREAKRENAKERQRRARARRKELFDALRELGIVPAWDTATGELQALLSRRQSQQVTQSVTAPVTRDDTATHTPDTSNKDQKPPQPPTGGEAPAKPSRAKVPTLDAYLADCAARGVEPIPDGGAVWRFADDAGIPREWIALAWWAFQGRYLGTKKGQASWPQKFRNAVAENWLRLWWLDGNDYRLTTAGMQVKREMEASA